MQLDGVSPCTDHKGKHTQQDKGSSALHYPGSMYYTGTAARYYASFMSVEIGTLICLAHT